MTFGPDELGRGIVLSPRSALPATFHGAPTYHVDERSLADPQTLIFELHLHWLRRRRVVLYLGIDKETLKSPERLDAAPYSLAPSFEFSQERLHFLIWANNYDATGDEPIWWYERLALRLGVASHDSAEVDLEGPRWCDGGPRTSVPFAVLHRESIKKRVVVLTTPRRTCRKSSPTTSGPPCSTREVVPASWLPRARARPES